SEPVGFLEVESEPDDDERLLRETALNDPRDPKRVVLNAAAKRLARQDWSGIITPTDDFVVFIAEHDEGFEPKYESVLEVNPPERLAAWDARWPAGASRGEDDTDRVIGSPRGQFCLRPIRKSSNFATELSPRVCARAGRAE